MKLQIKMGWKSWVSIVLILLAVVTMSQIVVSISLALAAVIWMASFAFASQVERGETRRREQEKHDDHPITPGTH